MNRRVYYKGLAKDLIQLDKLLTDIALINMRIEGLAREGKTDRIQERCKRLQQHLRDATKLVGI